MNEEGICTRRVAEFGCVNPFLGLSSLIHFVRHRLRGLICKPWNS